MKGMILAAGFGRRLMPLTKEIPKPLLPVKGKPIIVHIIEKMREAGFDEIIINLHHLGMKIQDEIGTGGKFDMKIVYSYEKEILGTGGGIKNVEDFFMGEEYFLVHNGDVFSDLSLRNLVQHHLKNPASGTICLVRGDESQAGLRVIGASEEGVVVSIYDSTSKVPLSQSPQRYIFSGIHLLTREIFKFLPEKRPSCIVRQGYIPMLEAGKRINAFIYDGFWTDIGSREAYERIKE